LRVRAIPTYRVYRLYDISLLKDGINNQIVSLHNHTYNESLHVKCCGLKYSDYINMQCPVSNANFHVSGKNIQNESYHGTTEYVSSTRHVSGTHYPFSHLLAAKDAYRRGYEVHVILKWATAGVVLTNATNKGY